MQIKDLARGARLAAQITDSQVWRKTRPAQFAVPEDQLVDTVRQLLEWAAKLRHVITKRGTEA